MNLSFHVHDRTAHPIVRATCFRCFDPEIPSASGAASDSLAARIKLAPQSYAASASQDYGQPAYARLGLSTLDTILNGTEGGTRTSSTPATQAGWYDASGKLVSTERVASATGKGGRQSCGQGTGTGGPSGATWYNHGQAVTSTTTDAPTTGLLAQMTGIRSHDIADVTNLAPGYRAAMAAGNPDAAKLLDLMTSTTSKELEQGRTPNFGEDRYFNDQAWNKRSGTLGAFGPAAQYQDALERSLYGDQLLQSRLSNASGAVTANQQFYGDPMRILSTSSGTVGQAAGLAAANGGQDFKTWDDMANTLFNAQSAGKIASANNDAAFGGAIMGSL